jgi:hypothetical protein
MDVLFGSHGVANADSERMHEINREIGLEAMIHGSVGEPKHDPIREKDEAKFVETESHSL